MKRHAFGAVLLAVVASVTLVTTHATSTRTWQVATRSDFLKGQLDGLSVDEFGRLLPGPVVSILKDTTGPFVWCLAEAPDGTLYAGTGNDGQVLAIEQNGKTSVFLDTKELEVHAIAVAPDGMVYAATSPDGRVYQVNAQGDSKVWFDPDEKYIWALAVDRHGEVYVGTGDKARVYRVDTTGKATVMYTSTAANVTALAATSQGQVVVGTESPGRVLRLGRDGKPFVLVDSPYREIRALRVAADGTVYAAAINGKAAADAPAPAQAAPPSPAAPSGGASVTADVTTVVVMDMPTVTGAPASSLGADASGPSKGAVYRIDSSGFVESVWESRDDAPYDLAIEAGGTLLVATGPNGRIYRTPDRPGPGLLVARLDAQQVTAIVPIRGGHLVALSNPGRLAKLASDSTAPATYTSEVKDAGASAIWGSLAWKAVVSPQVRVEVFTRSGNTEHPDDGWSDWDGPYSRSDGETVRSPGARYLQWKAVIRGAAASAGVSTPVLQRVTIAYRQRNARPKVADITVHPPGVVFQRPYPTGEPEIAGLDHSRPEFLFPVYSMPLGTPAAPGMAAPMGRRLYQKGLQAFQWRADDPNDDRLAFSVDYRLAGDLEWKPLRTGLLDQLAVWDTTSVQDGTYVIRVRASDRVSNLESEALTAQAESSSFDVDNTAPIVKAAPARLDHGHVVWAIDAEDAQSILMRLECSVNAGPWVVLLPDDGSADSRRERFTVRVPAGAVAPEVTVRVTDQLNNVTMVTSRVAPAATSR